MIEGKGPLFDKRTESYKDLWDAIEEYANCPSRFHTVVEELEIAIKIFANTVENCAIDQYITPEW